MTIGSVSVNPQTPTLVMAQAPEGTTLVNSGMSTVWIGYSPAVSTGNGIPITANGAVETTSAGSLYAILDSGSSGTGTLIFSTTARILTTPTPSPGSDAWSLVLAAPTNIEYDLQQSGSAFSWGSCTVRSMAIQETLSTDVTAVGWDFELYLPLIDSTLALGSLSITPAELLNFWSFPVDLQSWTGNQAAVSWDSSVGYSAPGSLKYDSQFGSSNALAQSPTIAANAGISYAASAWVLPDPTTANLPFRMEFINGSLAVMGSTIVTLGPAGVWQQVLLGHIACTANAPWRVALGPVNVLPHQFFHLDDVTAAQNSLVPIAKAVTTTLSIPKAPYVIQATKTTGGTSANWTLATDIIPSS